MDGQSTCHAMPCHILRMAEMNQPTACVCARHGASGRVCPHPWSILKSTIHTVSIYKNNLVDYILGPFIGLKLAENTVPAELL